MQIKTTIRFYYTPIRMAKTETKRNLAIYQVLLKIWNNRSLMLCW